jgi:hypothetical protein
MKRFLLPILVFLLFICNSAFSGASELEILGGINYLTYKPGKTEAYSESEKEKEFTPSLFLLANLNLRLDFSEKMNITLSIERDNILQNTLSTLFGLKTDYINVNFGVFAGLTDKFTKPETGITGNLELIAARTMFFSISGSSTLGTQYSFTNKNFRETLGAKLGFWAGNTIPSISADMKTYSQGGNITDLLYRLAFNMDFFNKNTNTSGYANAGYQVYSRTYEKETAEKPPVDSLDLYFAGFGFYWYGKPIGFKIGAEVPFYIHAKKPMTVSNSAKAIFSHTKAYAGFVFTSVN